MMNSLLGALVLTIAQTSDAAPSADDIRASVQRSLPYLEKEGWAWIKERKCNSCHFVPFMLWSHQEALNAGVKVDAKKFAEFADWSLDYSLRARQWYKLTDPTAKKGKTDGTLEPMLAQLKPMWNKPFVTERELISVAGKIVPSSKLGPHQAALVKLALQPKTGEKNDMSSMATLGQLLVGMAASKRPRMAELRKAAPDVMAKWQESNGSWRAAGQLPRQNRSGAESDQVITAWALLGLATLDRSDPAIKKMTDAGLAYFKKSKPGKTHERLLVQLLVEHRFGKPSDVAPLLKDVLSRQNPDGGWAWLPGGRSDPLTTGQSLYALSIVAGTNARPAIGRGQLYLLDAQTKDGIWDVPPLAVTDPKSNEGRVQRLVPIYDYWGTAWAAIGLSRSVVGML